MNPLRLLVLLTLSLSVVCNAELRTWTAVNGKEVEAEFVSNEKGIVKLKLKSGKVFEVPLSQLSKEDNEIISFLAKPEKVNPKPEGVNVEELERREGIDYLKGSDTAYTGKAFDLWKNGQKHKEFNYKDGKWDGPATRWHYNGQKGGEGTYKDGNPDGLHQEWYENGQKWSERNYKNGKMHGLWTEWYDNYDSPYQKPIGQKESEGTYKDNEKDGLWTEWYDNGQKHSESNWRNGKKDGLWTEWYDNGQKHSESNWRNGKKISEKWWNSKGEPVFFKKDAK